LQIRDQCHYCVFLWFLWCFLIPDKMRHFTACSAI
jgi:hypothetical protein